MYELIFTIFCIEFITCVFICLVYLSIKTINSKFSINNTEDNLDEKAKLKIFNKNKKTNALDDVPKLNFEQDEIKVESSFNNKRIGKI